MINYLPIEILSLILSKLKHLELLRIYSIICKRWNYSINICKNLYSIKNEYISIMNKKMINNTFNNSYTILKKLKYMPLINYVLRHKYFDLAIYLYPYSKPNYATENLILSSGNFKIIKWWFSRNDYFKPISNIMNFGWYLSKGDNFKIIEYIRNNYNYIDKYNSILTLVCIKYNNLKLLKLLLKNNYKLYPDACNKAIEYKNMKIYNWLLSNNYCTCYKN